MEFPDTVCGPDCQAEVNSVGYLVVENCPPKPCLKCGADLRHGKERTYREHECPRLVDPDKNGEREVDDYEFGHLRQDQIPLLLGPRRPGHHQRGPRPRSATTTSRTNGPAKPVELPEGTYQVEVPGEDLVALVLDTFRSELVERLEDADDETMKGLLMQAISTFSAILRRTEERSADTID